MQDERYRYLFGPVRSRRMGWSLGIDLVPSKTCSFNCPYCQIGRTVFQTIERREYVPAEAVIKELENWLAAGGQADFITLAGSGEPTLHIRFGDILEAIGRRTPIRRALLSNGSLFHLAEVRKAAVHADVVKGTLSAWDEASFLAVHRPYPSLTFDLVLSGLRAMRAECAGEFWIEVFLISGVNDARESVSRIAALVKGIKPTRVHLNTAVRPPAEAGVRPVPEKRLGELAALFTPAAEVVLTRTHEGPADALAAGRRGVSAARILGMVRRHPCTSADVAAGLNVSVSDVERQLDLLVKRRRVRMESRGQGTYYTSVS